MSLDRTRWRGARMAVPSDAERPCSTGPHWPGRRRTTSTAPGSAAEGEDREELGRVFNLLGAQGAARLDTSDFRFADLDARFPTTSR